MMVLAKWAVGFLSLGAGGMRSVEPISVQVSARPMPSFLVSLGGQIGQKLSARPEFSARVLMIRSSRTTREEALDQVAESLDARWEKREDGLLLVPDLARQRATESRRRDERIAEVKRFQAVLRRELSGGEEFGESQAKRLLADLRSVVSNEGRYSDSYERNLLRSPVPRAVREALLRAKPEWLAEIPVDYPAVYALNAYREEGELGAIGEYARQQFAHHQNVWAAVAPAKEVFAEGVLIASIDPRLSTSPVVATEIRPVFRFDFGDELPSIEVWFRDRNGVPVGHGSVQLPPRQSQVPAGLKAGEKAISLPATAISCARWFNDGVEPADGKTLRVQVENPLANDPLGLFVSPMIDAAASALGRSVVAVLPDSLFEDLLPSATKNRVPIDALFATLSTAGMELDDKDGWLKLRSAQPGNDDRQALARLIQGIPKKDGALAELLLDYARRAPDHEYPPALLTRYFARLDPSGANWLMSVDSTMVKFVGMLSPSVLRTLETEGKVPLGDLNPEAQATLHRIVFRQSCFVHPINKREKGPHFLVELPAEEIPGGLDPKGWVQWKPKPPEVGIWADNGTEKFFYPADYLNAAGLRKNKPSDGTPKIIGFTLDLFTGATLDFYLSDRVMMTREFRLPNGADPTIRRFEDLPKKIQDAISRFDDLLAPASPRGQGDGSPPRDAPALGYRPA